MIRSDLEVKSRFRYITNFWVNTGVNLTNRWQRGVAFKEIIENIALRLIFQCCLSCWLEACPWNLAAQFSLRGMLLQALGVPSRFAC